MEELSDIVDSIIDQMAEVELKFITPVFVIVGKREHDRIIKNQRENMNLTASGFGMTVWD